ncbi:hypothetical protein NQ318_012526 [Aromia moschata]|uniref:Helix-turn-helix domain-containing protein n=1 Tax=Aromia moschata TaxID=1265417 RepID=A0AAV8XG22_9CUCU|nr:hypothetical protein NQ318_012526 [Aromia moschata]
MLGYSKNIAYSIGIKILGNIQENVSSQVFDKEELNLLNKGLKFGLPASGAALEEVVAGVECAIQHLPDSSRGFVREAYNGEYFQQHEGTAMEFGSWYVDDIFAVFDTKAISLDNFVAKLNNRFPTIKFTYKLEHNELLPFLDVLVIRNSENKLEFDVYRKETATLRYIPNDSHHPFQHKKASFNFLIHRLLNFPLSKERFEHEKQLIKNIAKSNGYSVHLIDELIRKH